MNRQTAYILADVVFVLQIVFVVLKLAGAITWSWWWVLAPLWGYVGLLALTVLGWLGPYMRDRYGP